MPIDIEAMYNPDPGSLVQAAHDAFKQIPGLNPHFFVSGNAWGSICLFYLKPSCLFTTKEDADAFGAQLQKLCLGNRIAKAYRTKSIEGGLYSTELRIASNFNAAQFTRGDEEKLKSAMKHLEKNTLDIADLLMDNGIEVGEITLPSQSRWR